MGGLLASMEDDANAMTSGDIVDMSSPPKVIIKPGKVSPLMPPGHACLDTQKLRGNGQNPAELWLKDLWGAFFSFGKGMLSFYCREWELDIPLLTFGIPSTTFACA